MKFKEFAQYLEKLEKTSSRISITEILAELLKKAEADEIDKVVYLTLGMLAPSYESIVFNLAEKMVVRAVAEASKLDTSEVQSKYKKAGDLGNVVFQLSEFRDRKSDIGLSVSHVYNELVSIARDEGEGSQERKVSGLSALLKKVDPLSAKFIVRIPIGKLRLGFSDKTIIDALSWMEVGDKSKSAKLKLAYEVLPDVGKLAKSVKSNGIDKTSSFVTPEIGVPVMPVLAQRIKSTKEMIQKMGEVAVEPKFDGLRVLIHFARNKNGEKPFIRAFTRNLNDVSGMFPELSQLEKYLIGNEVILDTEGMGIDPGSAKMVDFQKTMQRRRKHDIDQNAQDIPFSFQVFDILYKDGDNLMIKEYRERRKILEKSIKHNKLFVIDESIMTNNPDVIKQKHKEYISKGLEGVIVKRLDSKYVPGRTGWRWVKMKEEEGSIGKLADTLDCVIMGFTSGKGKRVDFGIGQFLAGILKGRKIVSITKVGTGLTDEQLTVLGKRLTKLTVEKKPAEYEEVHNDYNPDFWVKPEVVVELAGDDLTVSTKHAAGYALRFPRLVRFRDDKSTKQITTNSEVVELYKLQKGK